MIGQLGKNYNDNRNKLISGKDLLNLAISSITLVQRVIGGKVIFLECEDKPELLKFYEENDFFKFGKRKLDRDETNIEGEYLYSGFVIQQNNNHYRAQISVMAISFKSYYNLKSTCCPIIFSLSV